MTTKTEELTDSGAQVSQIVIAEEGMHVIKVAKRSSTFYSVTESEIEMYSQYGLLSSILLTLFGAFIGFSFGCIVPILQGGLTMDVQITLWWLAGATGLSALIFFGLSIIIARLQNKTKQTWKSTK